MSYSFSMRTISDIGNPNIKYNYGVITTEIENAKPEIIRKRLIDVPHIGVNGGFFKEPAEGKGCRISYQVKNRVFVECAHTPVACPTLTLNFLQNL